MRLQIEARDVNRRPVGIVENVLTGTLTPRFNALGVWTLTLPMQSMKPEILAAWEANGGIRVVDLDLPATAAPVIAGPLTTDADTIGVQARYGGTITVSGVCDKKALDARICYPDPTQPWTNQGASSHDTRSGVAESVLRGYVNANAGPGALVDRRWPGLTLAADGGRGTSVAKEARFQNLLELLADVALVGGGLGFDVVDQGDETLLFTVYEPQLKADVLISMEGGTLRQATATVQAPDLTHALVAGQGEQEDRQLAERADLAAAAEWGMRIERLVDARNTGTVDGLNQDGDEALLNGAAKGQMVVDVQDTADVQYGRDYGLGDRVPYERRGAQLVDVVREVRIDLKGGSTTVKPTIGPASATATPETYKRLAAIEKTLRGLRNQ